MGIKNLNSFLKKKAPSAFIQRPISDLMGQSIAIDAFGYLYAHIHTLTNEIVNSSIDPLNIDRIKIFKPLVQRTLNFIFKLSQQNIITVWCWDGKHRPEKNVTKQKQKEEKLANLQKLAEIRNVLLQLDIFDRPMDLLLEYKKLLIKTAYIASDEIIIIQELLYSIGIISLKADTEGENLASALCQKGFVYAVYSQDTDNYALGTPIMITEITASYFQCVILFNILTELELNINSFRDFCILCGTDFNHNIYRIGAEKSYKLIKEYKSIDNIPLVINSQEHQKTLNYNVVRSILTPQNVNFEELPTMNADWLSKLSFIQQNINSIT